MQLIGSNKGPGEVNKIQKLGALQKRDGWYLSIHDERSWFSFDTVCGSFPQYIHLNIMDGACKYIAN